MLQRRWATTIVSAVSVMISTRANGQIVRKMGVMLRGTSPIVGVTMPVRKPESLEHLSGMMHLFVATENAGEIARWGEGHWRILGGDRAQRLLAKPVAARAAIPGLLYHQPDFKRTVRWGWLELHAGIEGLSSSRVEAQTLSALIAIRAMIARPAASDARP